MWIIYVIICIVLWGITDVLYKKGARKEEKYIPLKFSIVIGLICFLIALVYLITRDEPFTIWESAVRFWPVTIFGIVYAIVNTISFNEDEDTKKSSIFVVIKDKTITDETMQFDYDQDKITINLPEKQWNIYDKMKRISKFQDMYFSIMAVPALGYCLSRLQGDGSTDSIDSLRIEYKWFSAFADAYKRIHNKDLDDEDFFVKHMNVYTEAQLVLNSPVTKAMDGLFALTMGLGGTDDGD